MGSRPFHNAVRSIATADRPRSRPCRLHPSDKRANGTGHAKVVPGIPVLAIVLAHGAPLPLAQIGPPFLPRNAQLASFVESFLLGDLDIGKRSTLLGGFRRHDNAPFEL